MGPHTVTNLWTRARTRRPVAWTVEVVNTSDEFSGHVYHLTMRYAHSARAAQRQVSRYRAGNCLSIGVTLPHNGALTYFDIRSKR